MLTAAELPLAGGDWKPCDKGGSGEASADAGLLRGTAIYGGEMQNQPHLPYDKRLTFTKLQADTSQQVL